MNWTNIILTLITTLGSVFSGIAASRAHSHSIAAAGSSKLAEQVALSIRPPPSA